MDHQSDTDNTYHIESLPKRVLATSTLQLSATKRQKYLLCTDTLESSTNFVAEACALHTLLSSVG